MSEILDSLKIFISTNGVYSTSCKRDIIRIQEYIDQIRFIREQGARIFNIHEMIENTDIIIKHNKQIYISDSADLYVIRDDQLQWYTWPANFYGTYTGELGGHRERRIRQLIMLYSANLCVHAVWR